MVVETAIDTDALVATLAHFDVYYLRTAKAANPLPMTPDELMVAIIQHPSPRVREAIIPLFLRQPGFARYVPELSSNLPPTESVSLRHMYTAAVYLQHLWQGKLEMYLGPMPLLPNYFGQSEWGLPAPTEHFGRLVYAFWLNISRLKRAIIG